MPSFYVDFCERDQEIEIIADEYHHIINVFRYTIGDEISILNGKGLIAAGIIKKIEKKSLLLNVTHIRYYKRNEFKVACAFSLLKNKHDLFIVEKLTELGVCDLFPMQTKNSIKLSKENTIDKMMKTAITAMKQCNNPWLPTIHEFGGRSTLDLTLKKIKQLGYNPVCASELRPDLSLISYLSSNPNVNVCVIVGCEGGFDKSEFDFLYEQNVLQVKLNNNVLKAETAAIAAISQIMGIKCSEF